MLLKIFSFCIGFTENTRTKNFLYRSKKHGYFFAGEYSIFLIHKKHCI